MRPGCALFVGQNFFRKKPVVSAKNEADARAGGQLVDADEAASALDNAGGIDDVTVKNTLKMAGNIHGLDDFNDDAKVDIILESLRPVTAATHTRNTMSWCVALPCPDRPASSPQHGTPRPRPQPSALSPPPSVLRPPPSNRAVLIAAG